MEIAGTGRDQKSHFEYIKLKFDGLLIDISGALNFLNDLNVLNPFSKFKMFQSFQSSQTPKT